MPTVPVLASCVPLTGQAACNLASGDGAPGGGGLGGAALGCGALTVDATRRFERDGSTVTCCNGAVFDGSCVGAALGVGAGSVLGACCAGAAGAAGVDGESFEGVVCCAGDDSSACTACGLAAASAT